MEKDNRGWITSGFLSKHIGADKDYNENNAGIGYKSQDGWLGGYYRNSLDKDSFYGGKEFQTDPLIGDKKNETALGFIPPVKGVTPATLALQFRKRF